jgi:hypothetical protein
MAASGSLMRLILYDCCFSFSIPSASSRFLFVLILLAWSIFFFHSSEYCNHIVMSCDASIYGSYCIFPSFVL